MKNSKKIMAIMTIAATLGMTFVSWASPAEAVATNGQVFSIETGLDNVTSDTIGNALTNDSQKNYLGWYDIPADSLVYDVSLEATLTMPADGTFKVYINPWDFETRVSENDEYTPFKKGDVIKLFDSKLAEGIPLTSGMSPYGMIYAVQVESAQGSGCIWIKLTDGSASTTNANNANETAPSSSWAQDSKGWRINNTDGSYLTNAWYQDTDGKWYYMGTDGYMLTNTTTPDGYKVGADGVWNQ